MPCSHVFAEVDNYWGGGGKAKEPTINTVTQRPKVLVKLQTCYCK